jgi:hypothetical protein
VCHFFTPSHQPGTFAAGNNFLFKHFKIHTPILPPLEIRYFWLYRSCRDSGCGHQGYKISSASPNE